MGVPGVRSGVIERLCVAGGIAGGGVGSRGCKWGTTHVKKRV